MRIALYSHLFPPHLGGSGVHAKLLAEGFAVLGHAVTVITSTSSGAEETTSPFQLVRRPKLRQLCAMLAQSDLVLEVGPCMTAGFWHAPCSSRWWLPTRCFRRQECAGWQIRVLCTGVPNIAPSAAVGRALPISSTVIPNPHDDSVFKKWTAINDRKRDLVFVGRLIKEKGLQNVLLALNHLREKGDFA